MHTLNYIRKLFLPKEKGRFQKGFGFLAVLAVFAYPGLGEGDRNSLESGGIAVTYPNGKKPEAELVAKLVSRKNSSRGAPGDPSIRQREEEVFAKLLDLLGLEVSSRAAAAWNRQLAIDADRLGLESPFRLEQINLWRWDDFFSRMEAVAGRSLEGAVVGYNLSRNYEVIANFGEQSVSYYRKASGESTVQEPEEVALPLLLLDDASLERQEAWIRHNLERAGFSSVIEVDEGAREEAVVLAIHELAESLLVGYVYDGTDRRWLADGVATWAALKAAAELGIISDARGKLDSIWSDEDCVGEVNAERLLDWPISGARAKSKSESCYYRKSALVFFAIEEGNGSGFVRRWLEEVRRIPETERTMEVFESTYFELSGGKLKEVIEDVE